MMDYFANLVANKTSFPKTAKNRKVYINEDPSHEETGPCPSCTARNRSSSVRYMYVNLQEAIYKCESPNCMYPFQNFKFKNYTDNTVYYYTSAEDTPPALEGFGPTFTNVASPAKCKNEHPPSADDSSIIDFSLHFFSPERGANNPNKASGHAPGHNTSLNIFDSPSLSYKNLVQDFDTGFIDDILQDLGQPSPEKPKPVLVSPVRVVDTKSTTGRQLKRCLQMFKETATPSEVTFKVPPLPGSEVPSPPKIKSKKHSPLRRHKHSRRPHSSSGGSSSEKLLKKRKLKPLEFIETINSIHPKKTSSAEQNVPGVKSLNNRRVENMLNFIERSMKNRQPKPLATTCQPVPSPPPHSVVHPTEHSPRSGRKCHKKTSLSAAVLHDSQFEYSTSESEQEDAPEMFFPTPIIPESEGDLSLGSLASSLPSSGGADSNDSMSNASEQSLPSFEDLLMHIHPGEPKLQQPSSFQVGFRSAGSSPTRVPQWAKTPPRRIHSMESLCSLLE